jgi:hypothetical protein
MMTGINNPGELGLAGADGFDPSLAAAAGGNRAATRLVQETALRRVRWPQRAPPRHNPAGIPVLAAAAATGGAGGGMASRDDRPGREHGYLNGGVFNRKHIRLTGRGRRRRRENFRHLRVSKTYSSTDRSKIGMIRPSGPSCA